ncbi:MAG TPA: NUDIX hydrolase [Thermodesulfovibrionales bacterium]|nr:NUDIX hydrolase [Thermodesulfovibrionales bacterium]
MKKYEIIDKEAVWEGKYLRFLEITYGDSEGTVRKWESVDRVNCDGVVAILPVTDSEEVVFVRQFRPAVSNYVIEFPAGLNDREEKLEDAARRELLEETGYEAGELLFLARGPLSSGASAEVLTVYFARGLRFRGIEGRDETEDIEVLKIPIDEMFGQLSLLEAEGNFIDLKVFGLIELARRRGVLTEKG